MPAPSPLSAPLPAGTPVALEPAVQFYGDDLVAGGSPWRLLRVSGRARAVLDRWRHGGVVAAGEERFARTLVQQGLLLASHSPADDLDDVDVVIPVRDDPVALEGLLGHLDGFSVTVVDDGSTDAATVSALAGRHGARLVRHDTSRGAGAARNTGARSTTADFLWFVDVDLILDDARRVASLLRGAARDPLVGAAAPRVLGAPGRSVRDRFEQSFGALDLGGRAGLVHPLGPVPYVPSACLLVRRDAFGEGFAEEMAVGEDVDLVWRLVDDGWAVRYLAEVHVVHPARTSWSAWWRQRVSYGRSSGELAARHGEAMAPLRADRWTLVAWAGALARAPWLSARAVSAVRASLRERLESSTDDPTAIANALVSRTVLRAGGPMARAVTRTYGPFLWAAAAHPRLRRRALVVLALGTAWRFRGTRGRLFDVPLALADDFAYGVGVVQGAWRARSLRSLTPVITPSSVSWRDALGAGGSKLDDAADVRA